MSINEDYGFLGWGDLVDDIIDYVMILMSYNTEKTSDSEGYLADPTSKLAAVMLSRTNRQNHKSYKRINNNHGVFLRKYRISEVLDVPIRLRNENLYNYLVSSLEISYSGRLYNCNVRSLGEWGNWEIWNQSYIANNTQDIAIVPWTLFIDGVLSRDNIHTFTQIVYSLNRIKDDKVTKEVIRACSFWGKLNWLKLMEENLLISSSLGDFDIIASAAAKYGRFDCITYAYGHKGRCTLYDWINIATMSDDTIFQYGIKHNLIEKRHISECLVVSNAYRRVRSS